MNKRKHQYWTGAHTKHCLRYHLVWIPKYRKRVLRGELVSRLTFLIYQAAEVNNWWVHELTIDPDHIHIYIQTRPTESVAAVVQKLKGGTSYIIRQEYPELEEFLWGKSFWADGYFAETSGRLAEQRIRDYIRAHRSSLPQQQQFPGL